MKRILIALTLLAPSLSSQESEPVESKQTLPGLISQIAEAEQITAADYLNIASGTLQIADALKQQGQQLPESVLTDALNAVANGRELHPDFPQWDGIEQKLLDHLNPPEEQPQQDQQNPEDQEGEQGEDQDGQSGESDQQDSSEGEDSQSEENQQNQEGEQEQNSEQQSQQDQSEQDQSQSGQGEQGEEGGEQQPNAPSQDGAQMGELDEDQENKEVKLDQTKESQQDSSPEKMQTLGGQNPSNEPVQADQAAIRLMLDQLKQQDQPGKLFKILQDAQKGERRKSQPNEKDW